MWLQEESLSEGLVGTEESTNVSVKLGNERGLEREGELKVQRTVFELQKFPQQEMIGGSWQQENKLMETWSYQTRFGVN